MPRAKRGFKARRRRNKILKAAKGFVGARRRQYRPVVTLGFVCLGPRVKSMTKLKHTTSSHVR